MSDFLWLIFGSAGVVGLAVAPFFLIAAAVLAYRYLTGKQPEPIRPSLTKAEAQAMTEAELERFRKSVESSPKP